MSSFIAQVVIEHSLEGIVPPGRIVPRDSKLRSINFIYIVSITMHTCNLPVST
jgi:hypothetical protein